MKKYLDKEYNNNINFILKINDFISEYGVALFGAGQYGELVAEYLIDNGYHINCFIDNDKNKSGKDIYGIKIVSNHSELAKKQKVVLITAHHAVGEIMNQISTIYEYVESFEKWFVFINYDRFISVRDNMHDNKSKYILDSIMMSKVMGNNSYLKEIYEDNQYFAVNEFKFGSTSEIYLNLGAYTGDTIERIIYSRLGGFKHIYAFEPGHKQFEAMKNRIDRLKKEWAIDDNRITLVNLGVSNNIEELDFTDNVSLLNSRVAITNSNIKIQTTTIDNYLQGKEINFLISDIEGFELKMLKGAKNTIQKYKPKMAISVYHKPDDIFKILEYIKTLVPEYKFYLRHHNIYLDDTVLYCCTEQNRTEQNRTEQNRTEQIIYKKVIYKLYINNTTLNDKLQPMLQNEFVA